MFNFKYVHQNLTKYNTHMIWVIAQCRLVDFYKYFGKSYDIHLQGNSSSARLVLRPQYYNVKGSGAGRQCRSTL